jgi:hypothetical protein
MLKSTLAPSVNCPITGLSCVWSPTCKPNHPLACIWIVGEMNGRNRSATTARSHMLDHCA